MPTSAAVAAATLNCITVGNTADLTVSGFGTPTAAVVFTSNANTGSNPQANAALSVGFWTSANQCAVDFAVMDARSAETASNRRQQSGIVAGALNEIGGSDLSLITVTASSITDGIRLTVASTSSSAVRYVYAILISGTLNAYVGSQSLGTGTSAVDITAPGFRPDLVLLATNGAGANAIANHAIWSLGVAHNDGTTTTQGFVAFASSDAASATQSSVHISSTHCATQHFQDATSWQASAGSFDSSGFSLTPSASAGNDVVYYLALELADPGDAYVGVVDSKTSTGTQAYTGVGFEPQALALWQTLNTSVGIMQGSSLSLGATDGTTSRALSVRDTDAATTTSATSEANLSNPLFIELNDGSTDAVAAFSSFDADGWTLDYSDGSASARKILALAIGDSTSAPALPTLSALTTKPGTLTSTGLTVRVTAS